MRLLLYPFAVLYGLGVRTRNLLFDIGILKSKEFDLPIISVGNLSAGGTGKSPHVGYLAMLLKDKMNVVILSRGYGRVTRGFRLIQPEDTAAVAGDEPLQYKKTIENIIVAVSEDRVEGIHQLLSAPHPPDVILLDDAFQHRYVKPGLNILLTEFNNLYTDDHLLPVGSLREPYTGSKRASIIIVTKCPAVLTLDQQENIRKRLRVNHHQQLFFSNIHYAEVMKLQDGNTILLEELKHRKVLLLTGIANPKLLANFIQSVAKGMDQMIFRDHHQYTIADVDQLRAKFNKFAKQDGLIITTRKDFMRLHDPALQDALVGLPIAVIDIEIKILEPGATPFNLTILNYVKAHSGVS
ncbi:tetraacyldisaccharide 4'-kinase [soil metagenome]